VGRLAGGIAHDFNNLLTAILGFARLIHDALPDDHASQQDVQEIMNAGERAAKLTNQLLAFGRKQVPQMHPLDLNAVVLNMDQILRRTLGEDIELVTLCGEHLGSIEADPGLLEQVVMNLAVNARDAMPKGGKLVISTRNTSLTAEYCAKRVGVQPGNYVVMTVKDTGVGMSEAVREHVFEPFFTTKEKGKGSGLGLSTVYGIVKQFRGHIELVTAPGAGAEFHMFFPRASAPAQPPAVTPAMEALRGTETILLVEDESTVRRLTVRNLESLGYRVLEAGNGEDALRVFRESGGPIRVVITDVVMPQMSGPDLAAKLRAIDPAIKVLFISGFTDDYALDRAAMEQTAALIRKPFSIETLAHAVRRIIESP
jgi:CheY-like chemotaxis protein